MLSSFLHLCSSRKNLLSSVPYFPRVFLLLNPTHNIFNQVLEIVLLVLPSSLFLKIYTIIVLFKWVHVYVCGVCKKFVTKNFLQQLGMKNRGYREGISVYIGI